MTVRDIIARHPRPAGVDRDLLSRCVEACVDCSASCSSCADACLGEPDVSDLVGAFG